MRRPSGVFHAQEQTYMCVSFFDRVIVCVCIYVEAKSYASGSGRSTCTAGASDGVKLLTTNRPQLHHLEQNMDDESPWFGKRRRRACLPRPS
ncbi:hypothetical protein PVAP13_1KG495010 [Panicum virgatum]|uniref:Uncharacterized protein n=1 Tax=Panicum virgatum TaxID=38727 RepID=A0A8T0XVZ3_PANVG|nr:hypothetical protein PVAP13_1KG495010 [Panicum virgatum]